MTETTARRFDRSRLRLGIVIAVICGAMAFLLINLGQATAFFANADEAADQPVGRRFRLQGTVVPGSLTGEPGDLRFDVEYGCVRVPVRHTGVQAGQFQEGIPVVLEGEWADERAYYASERMYVKHTEEYTQEERDRLEAAKQECGGGSP